MPLWQVLKCWEAWDTTYSQYRHKAKDITPSVAWRRGMGRGSARRPSLRRRCSRGRAIINQTNIATLGKLLRDRVERIWAFPSTQIPPWTKLNIHWALFSLWLLSPPSHTYYSGTPNEKSCWWDTLTLVTPSTTVEPPMKNHADEIPLLFAHHISWNLSLQISMYINP